MQKWEYCVLVNVFATGQGLDTFYPALFRFTSKGAELVTDFQDRPEGISHFEYEGQSVARMIYQLGEEGWEMVHGDHMSESTRPDPANLWFKRTKD